jgi:hypothetical protein
MAQIIKHRRGLIGGVKNLTARNGELIIASGSILDLAGPFVFIGSPNAVDEGVAGAFNSVSKLYTGTAAPTITAATYGSALDGTPFYASSDKSLYILNNSNVGNSKVNLTGNIEGNTISGVTINNLTGSRASFDTYVSASALTVTGNTLMGGTLTVNGEATINNNLTVTGATNSNGALNVTGTTTLYGQAIVNNNLTVTGTTNSNGALNVTGTTTLYGQSIVNNNLTVTGTTNLNGAANVTGTTTLYGQSIVNNNLTVTGTTNLNGAVNITGTTTINNNLIVTGDTSIGGNLTITGNTYQTGSIYTQGNIVLSGSINIGDFTGDTINFGGEVSSSILPAVNNAFDLGGPSNAWNDLYVSGTAYIENINLASISISTIALPGDLTVSGTTTLSGSVYIDDLTEKRLVVAGVDGILMDYSGLTFDNGNLNVSGAIEVTNIQGTGSLYLKPDKNDSRLFEIYNTNPSGYTDIHFAGNADLNYFGDDTNYLKLDSVSSSVTLNSDNRLDIESQNGSIYFNDNSTNNIYLQGDTYFNTGTTMYVTKMVDNNDGTNYLELYGNGTDDGYWWESGTGRDTTLYSDETANINILNISGKINISGSNSINISSVDGTNITGSLVVSDASGVFNSSLIAYNSDLTLSGGSDIQMEDSAHLYFNSQNSEIFYNTSGNINELTLYNGANNSIRLDNNVNVSDDLYVSGTLYIDDIRSQNGNATNSLHLNGGTFSAPDVELASSGQISLFSEGSDSNYAINMTGSVHMYDGLDVTGSSTFLGGVTFGTSPTITGLTENRIVIVGSAGLLEDDANFTFDAQTFKIGDGDFEVDVTSGSIRTSGSLLVKNGIQLTGSLRGQDSSSNWSILGNGFGETYIQSTTGNMMLQASIGEVTVKTGNFRVETNAKIDGTLQVSGNTSLTGSLTVASGSATMLGGDLYVSGNLQVLGSSTNVNIQSQTVNIGDNIVQVNAYSPFDRYAGLSAYDSGSSGDSGSFLWDSTNDYWLIVNANGNSSKIIGTTASTGGTGTEISLTSGVFPIASASNTIGDSLLTYTGTTLAFNTNKFTIDSVSGNTAISGNLTLSYSGGTDGGTKTSKVTFRNSSNVIGFISTTETTNELDGILGYNHSTGVLEFSTLIDGGTY